MGTGRKWWKSVGEKAEITSMGPMRRMQKIPGSMLASMMDEHRGSIAQAKFDLDVQELSPLLITPGHLQVYGNSSEGPVLLQLSPLCSVFFFFFHYKRYIMDWLWY